MKKKTITDEPVSLTNEEIFLEFLKEHKLKLAYSLELKKHRGITLTAYLSRYSWRRFGVGKVLQNGFRFLETEQGRDYWLAVNDKWKEVVKNRQV
jgi:hypothetical protein